MARITISKAGITLEHAAQLPDVPKSLYDVEKEAVSFNHYVKSNKKKIIKGDPFIIGSQHNNTL